MPLGQFVAACHPQGAMSFAHFTMTAYDPVLGQFIAMGHSYPENLVGKRLCQAVGMIPAEGESAEAVRRDTERTVGIVTCQGFLGVSGPYYEEPGEALLTDAPKPGKARLVTSLLPEGESEVNILTVNGTGFSIRGERLVHGMSGAPILQDGCIVGVLWGGTPPGKGECRRIESVTDRMLDAWAGEPEGRPPVRRTPEEIRALREERLREAKTKWEDRKTWET